MKYVIAAVIISLTALFFLRVDKKITLQVPNSSNSSPTIVGINMHDLSIEAMRQKVYPGSEIIIEQTLDPGINYDRYIASYKSEGLKINALLTVPKGQATKGGWPAIIFNHGYIPPREYRTTERYIAYVDGFARNNYIVFKPDYRGHGSSEGEPSGAYGSNGYTVDVLNAVASIKKYRAANPNKIGMWGHSLGGFITLRNLVVNKDIKVAVIWAGVVASYQDLLNNWNRRNISPPPGIPTGARRWRQVLVEEYGEPDQNPKFWNSISANSYLEDIEAPLQLHHGSGDSTVPIEFSEKLYKDMKEIEKKVEFNAYPNDDHNIANFFNLAMQRSIEFFDKYLK